MSYIYVKVSEDLELMVNPDCPNRLLTEHIRRQILLEGPENLVLIAMRGAPPKSRIVPSEITLGSFSEGEFQNEDYKLSESAFVQSTSIQENIIPTQIDLINRNGNFCGLYFYKPYENPYELGLVKEGKTYFAVLVDSIQIANPTNPILLLEDTYPDYFKLLEECENSMQMWIQSWKDDSKMKMINKLERDVDDAIETSNQMSTLTFR